MILNSLDTIGPEDYDEFDELYDLLLTSYDLLDCNEDRVDIDPDELIDPDWEEPY